MPRARTIPQRLAARCTPLSQSQVRDKVPGKLGKYVAGLDRDWPKRWKVGDWITVRSSAWRPKSKLKRPGARVLPASQEEKMVIYERISKMLDRCTFPSMVEAVAIAKTPQLHLQCLDRV